jgi:hypothetical protein
VRRDEVLEMNAKKNGQAISREVALQLCEEIRKEKGVRLFSQCWGCEVLQERPG